MVWRAFVLTTDRSMILATRYCSEGLDEQGPITEGHYPSIRSLWEANHSIAQQALQMLEARTNRACRAVMPSGPGNRL